MPIYAAVFVLVIFILRIIVVSRRTGLGAKALLGRQDGLHGLIGLYFKFLPLLSGFVIVVYLTDGYEYLGPFLWLEHGALIGTGLFLLITTLIWIWLSQTQMGKAWRIGIDGAEKSELITNGVFSLTRNPIFLGIKLNAFGFFLVLPNAITLAILLLGNLLIDVQVRLEENHLTDKYGDVFVTYCDRVRRWV